MPTYCTQSFVDQLATLGEQVDEFVQEFSEWKKNWPAGEYHSYIFGKDGGYYGAVQAAVTSGRLKHVHLVPLCDLNQLSEWNKAWRRRSRKTSDRALVYAEDNSGNYLLIFILDEPTAHEIARMRTSENKTLMLQFAAVADAWAFNGEIIA